MNTHTIAPTTPDDIRGLQTVLDLTGLFPSALLPDMFAQSISDSGDALWLTCRLGGSAAGFCYSVPEEMTVGTWNMRALAVRPDVQRQRLGSALISATEQRLREMEQRILIVDTSGTDAFAQTRKFYAQNGYCEEARIRDFWADGDDKVIFRKTLH